MTRLRNLIIRLFWEFLVIKVTFLLIRVRFGRGVRVMAGMRLGLARFLSIFCLFLKNSSNRSFLINPFFIVKGWRFFAEETTLASYEKLLLEMLFSY